MLAIIAGTGALPGEIVAQLETRPLVCSMAGYDPTSVQAELSFRLEHLGSFLAELTERGISEICMAGAVGRPSIDPSAIDAATFPLVPVLQAALGAGDDGALRAVVEIFETSGFSVKSAQEVAPDLLMIAGVPTQVQPGELDKAGIALWIIWVVR